MYAILDERGGTAEVQARATQAAQPLGWASSGGGTAKEGWAEGPGRGASAAVHAQEAVSRARELADRAGGVELARATVCERAGAGAVVRRGSVWVSLGALRDPERSHSPHRRGRGSNGAVEGDEGPRGTHRKVHESDHETERTRAHRPLSRAHLEDADGGAQRSPLPPEQRQQALQNPRARSSCAGKAALRPPDLYAPPTTVTVRKTHDPPAP